MKKTLRYRILLLVFLVACFGWGIRRYNFSALPNGGFGLGKVHQFLQRKPGPDKRTENPTIIGHRGVWIELKGGRGGGGNTLESIQMAVDADVDWIEVDVRKSKDGTLFLFHDEDVRRMTDAAKCFPDCTEWRFESFADKDIATLRVDYPGKGVTVPTLATVLTQFSSSSGTRFILDLKDDSITPDELRAAVGDLDPDRFILFGREACLKLFAKKEKQSSGEKLYTLGYTALWTEEWNKIKFLFSHDFLLRKCDELGCEYLVLPALFLNQSLIDRTHDSDRKVLAYGIDEKHPFKVTDLGVDGLIVDDPSEVIRKYAP